MFLKVLYILFTTEKLVNICALSIQVLFFSLFSRSNKLYSRFWSTLIEVLNIETAKPLLPPLPVSYTHLFPLDNYCISPRQRRREQQAVCKNRPQFPYTNAETGTRVYEVLADLSAQQEMQLSIRLAPDLQCTLSNILFLFLYSLSHVLAIRYAIFWLTTFFLVEHATRVIMWLQ